MAYGYCTRPNQNKTRKFDGNNNYYIHNNLAYTEDNVLVYNLFIHNIPRQLSTNDLLKYFSVFGKVNKVSLLTDKKPARRSGVRAGFVDFHEPPTAATVLLKRNHTINMKRFSVKAGDSWRQPVSPRPIKEDNQNDQSIENPNEQKVADDADLLRQHRMSLLHLNDDCLEHICQQLDLRDQVSFARSCRRLAGIFVLCARVKHKMFSLDRIDGMTLWEQREFFSLTGPHMEIIIGGLPMKNRERIVEFMCQFCVNTKSLNLDSCRIRIPSLNRLCDNLKLITELELHDCGLHDNSILNIKKLPNLNTLSLSENYELTGKHLNKLKTVQDLSLYHCSNVQSNYLIAIVEALVDLKSLNLQGCYRLTSEVCARMATHALKLETLKISMSQIRCESIATIPNLKSLEVVSSVSISLPAYTLLFAQLAKHKANNLEHLKIVAKNTINRAIAADLSCLKKLKVLVCNNNQNLDDECLRILSGLESLEELTIAKSPSITNDGLLHLLSNCLRLRRVNIQGCEKINDEFVHKAIALLRRTEKERSGLVTFLVGRTDISQLMLQNADYLQAANENIIALSFPMPVLDEIELLGFEDYDDDDVDDDFDLEDDDLVDDYAFLDSDDFSEADNLDMAIVMAGLGHEFYDYIW